MSASLWPAFVAELDRWSATGLTLRLWLRDDDAIAPTPALSRLAALAERFGAPVLLAVIPMQAEPALAQALRSMPALLPCQHGCHHRNQAPPGAKKSEFPAARGAEAVDAEIALARARLTDLLADALLPVFVPPWNRIDPAHAARLPALGFAGLSCFRDDVIPQEQGPARLPTHLDVMDWKRGRVGRAHDDLLAELLGLLARRREAGAGASAAGGALGVLLHHRDHDDTVWSFLDTLLKRVAAHPSVSVADPRDLLADAGRRSWIGRDGRL